MIHCQFYDACFQHLKLRGKHIFHEYLWIFKNFKHIPHGFLWKLKKVKAYLSKIFFLKNKNLPEIFFIDFYEKKKKTYFWKIFFKLKKKTSFIVYHLWPTLLYIMPTLVVIGKCSTRLVGIEPANSEPNNKYSHPMFSFVTKFHTMATKKS